MSTNHSSSPVATVLKIGVLDSLFSAENPDFQHGSVHVLRTYKGRQSVARGASPWTRRPSINPNEFSDPASGRAERPARTRGPILRGKAPQGAPPIPGACA